MNFLAQFKNREIEYNSIRRFNDFKASVGDCKIRVRIEKIGSRRSLSQNNAIHLYFDQVSKKFQEAGLDARAVFKKEIDIPMTPELVKHMWHIVQWALLKKKRTRDLTSSEVTKVFEVFNKHLAERFKFHVPFPSREFIEGLDY